MTDPALIARVESYAEEAEHEAARIEREAADLPRRVTRDVRYEREKAADLRALLARIRELEAERDAATIDPRIAAADFLFQLLDDIDTMSDVAKSDDAGYRAAVECIQRRRFEVADTDGYTVTFKERAALASAPAEGGG